MSGFCGVETRHFPHPHRDENDVVLSCRGVVDVPLLVGFLNDEGDLLDPNEILQKAVEGARAIIARDVEHNDADLETAQAVLDLHDWLSKGGFLPAAWAR